MMRSFNIKKHNQCIRRSRLTNLTTHHQKQQEAKVAKVKAFAACLQANLRSLGLTHEDAAMLTRDPFSPAVQALIHRLKGYRKRNNSRNMGPFKKYKEQARRFRQMHRGGYMGTSDGTTYPLYGDLPAGVKAHLTLVDGVLQ